MTFFNRKLTGRFLTSLVLISSLALGSSASAAPKAAPKSSPAVQSPSAPSGATQFRDNHGQMVLGLAFAFGNLSTLFGAKGEFLSPVGSPGLMLGMESGFFTTSVGGALIPLLATIVYRLNPGGSTRGWVGGSLGPAIAGSGGASAMAFVGNMKGGVTIQRWNLGGAIYFGDAGTAFGLTFGHVFDL